RDRVVTLAEHRRIELLTRTEGPAIATQLGAVRFAVRVGIELVIGAHDLGRTPGLIDTQVADDIRHLLVAVLPRRTGRTKRTTRCRTRVSNARDSGAMAGWVFRR